MSGGFSMIDLFRTEVDTHTQLLSSSLLSIEQSGVTDSLLEALMRAAHSLKGAARLVSVNAVVRLAHVLEDLFVAAQRHELQIGPDGIDVMLQAVDAIISIAQLDDAEMQGWDVQHADHLAEMLSGLENYSTQASSAPIAPVHPPVVEADSPVDLSMIDLFRAEVDNHGKAISQGILGLEANAGGVESIDALMRAAHSIKGAARLVNVVPVVRLSHVMEDVFVTAQKQNLQLTSEHFDILLAANDQIMALAHLPNADIGHPGQALLDNVDRLAASLQAILISTPDVSSAASTAAAPPAQLITDSAQTGRRVAKRVGQNEIFNTSIKTQIAKSEVESASVPEHDKVLRITADRWDRMMGLAGEIKVEAGRLHPYVDGLAQIKKRQVELLQLIESLREMLDNTSNRERLREQVINAQRKATDCRQLLVDRLGELDSYERRLSNLSARLHRESITTRMRPFSDGVHGFQRMVRDIARSLGKKVRLDIHGLNTQVDRDVLERMEAPLNHILRNAVDHGVELPDSRLAAGKPESATIVLSASHSEGMLSIIVEDDGCGINVERLRGKVIEKGLVSDEMAGSLTEEELLEFLFLPSFSTRDQVTDISGRGVGLDVVLDTIQKMQGAVRVTTQPGKGSRFHMQLPLTLSVLSALIVSIGGEMYAFPMARIVRAVKVPVSEIQVLEDHQYAVIDGQNIGLVGATEVFEMGEQGIYEDTLPVVVISDKQFTYGVVVDCFVGQRELALQALDRRVGKLQDINAAAVLEDGSTVLVIDVDDMVRTIDNLVRGGRVGKVNREEVVAESKPRILIVDDSLTVREVERAMLEEAGYQVDQAVDGKDGWNAVRTSSYDLIISDIDMPRMDGIELVRLIKSDQRYSSLPVIIVSYKDRAEDRLRGMEAGADYYLTKGSFHDDTLLHAVYELIGGPGE